MSQTQKKHSIIIIRNYFDLVFPQGWVRSDSQASVTFFGRNQSNFFNFALGFKKFARQLNQQASLAMRNFLVYAKLAFIADYGDFFFYFALNQQSS